VSYSDLGTLLLAIAIVTGAGLIFWAMEKEIRR
jgi:hypothetical protein